MENIDFFTVDVEQVDWLQSQAVIRTIRQTVFVDEQGVPQELAVDEQDPMAQHWIAYNEASQPVGVARLADYQIGRMAVLKPFRDKGVGSAILRRILKLATDTSLDHLQLNAQLHAVPFYAGVGFEVCGAQFEEAGIPHLPMKLDLGRFSATRPIPEPVDIDPSARVRIPLDNAEEFREHALLLAGRAQREIRIFSARLDPAIYDHAEFSERLFEFATAHASAKIYLLVRDVQWLVQHSHRLLALYARLPSRVEIRALNPGTHTLHSDFMLIDREAILYNQSADRYIGYAQLDAPRIAAELALDFDNLWENSAPDPEFRDMRL